MTRRQEARTALANTLDDLRLEGLKAAYRRAVKILNDDQAPATAHAVLVRVMFQASGLGSPVAEEPDKDAHEMTAEELDAAIQKIVGAKDQTSAPGIFG